jgi:AP-1 complex subunit gamma-1
MKLTASPHFPEKRIGYLGMMLLLSEDADVLMLATNSLKNDMNSENRFVAGLALCAIGNLATADMSRDLAPEVDKHLKSANPYLRKKACLAMSRCLSKCPDMVEDFVERVVTLLKDKSHGVLITVVELMTQVLIVDADTAEEEGYENLSETPCRVAFLRLVPVLVKLLRNLLSQGYSPEYDVGGISDPFLQVQILTVFRLLGAGNEAASEEMNDVLAQVATNTETSKNAGNAILYECVQTIMAIESEDSLRVLAVNILGRFLLNRDNNIRYVALNTLAKCIVSGRDELSNATENANSAASALQRHRTTVVDCLKDPDVSIRQRALELIYHLVNDENVEDLTAELLNYLVLCPREHRGGICTRILRVVDRFSPDDRWRVDTLITMLTIAGRETSREVQSATIIYISRASQDIQAYATHKLLKAIRDDDGTQRGLLTVGVWCIGEYGDLLLTPYSYTSPGGESGPVTISFMSLEPVNIVETLQDVTKKHSCPPEVKERTLTAYAKLSDRFATSDPATVVMLQGLLQKSKGHHSLEMQLRSCEYDALLNAAKGIAGASSAAPSDDIFGVSETPSGSLSAVVVQAAKDALARMPVVDLKVMKKKQASDEFFGENQVGAAQKPRAMANSGDGGDLLDLNDIFGGTSSAPVVQNGVASVVKAPDAPKSDVDLLSDIFSAPPITAAAPASGGFDPFSGMPAPQQAVNPMDLFGAPPAASPFSPAPVNPMDLFGAPPAQASVASMGMMGMSNPMAAPMGMSNSMAPAAPMGMSNPTAPAPSAPTTGPVVMPGFSHQGLSVEFHCTKPDTWNKQKSVLVAQFSNMTDAPIYGLSMQVAVPKYIQMEMQPPTSTTVPQTGGNNKTVTQTITITNTMLGSKNLMLKIKVGFTTKGTKVDHMATCSGFTAGEY